MSRWSGPCRRGSVRRPGFPGGCPRCPSPRPCPSESGAARLRSKPGPSRRRYRRQTVPRDGLHSETCIGPEGASRPGLSRLPDPTGRLNPRPSHRPRVRPRDARCRRPRRRASIRRSRARGAASGPVGSHRREARQSIAAARVGRLVRPTRPLTRDELHPSESAFGSPIAFRAFRWLASRHGRLVAGTC